MATHTHTYTSPRTERVATGRTVAQALAAIVGLGLVVIGVAGFIPSLTTHTAELTNSGTGSRAMLFDTFQVSVLHNIVHIALGVIGLLAANGPRMARTFLLVGGLGFLALFAYGMMIDLSSDQNVLPLNDADNWLHLGIGAGMFVLGMLATMPAIRSRRHALDTPDD